MQACEAGQNALSRASATQHRPRTVRRQPSTGNARTSARQCAAAPLVVVIVAHAEIPATILHVSHSARQADRWS